MNFYKHLTISFLTALLTLVVGYGGYTIYAAGSDEEVKNYYTFTDYKAKFSTVKDAYHSSLNDFFDDKFEQLVELLDKNKFSEDPNFSAPKNVDSVNYKDLCGVKNVSTYCVSMEALDLYIAYLNTLENMRNYLPKEELKELQKSHPNASVKELLALNTTRNQQIDAEIISIKPVLTATIDAYDQFRLAYPSHKRYQALLNDLNKYKIALKKVGDQTLKFPGKFIDSTSLECK